MYNVTNIIVNKSNPVTTNYYLKGCNSVLFNNKTYTTSTIVRDTVRTSQGCDSIYNVTTININKITPVLNTLNLSGCNSYIYKNVTYTSSAVVKDTIRTSQGCDSIYTVANITVKLSTSSTTSVTVPSLPFTWNGNNYSAAGVYTIHLTNNAGCDSAATLNLTVNTTAIIVSGNILTPLGKPVPSVTANLSGSSTQTNTVSSLYSFNLSNNATGAVKLYKNNEVNKDNGVSGIDVAHIQSHILAKNILNSPYKIIAADINGDTKISTLDIVYIKRLILGLDTTFTNSATKQSRTWVFVDSSFQFSNPSIPFPFKDSIGFTNLTSGLSNQSFIGIKLGDVNWDWNPAVARPVNNTRNAVELSYMADAFKSSGEVRIPIIVKNFKDLLTMQFTVNFDAGALKWKGINNNLLNVDIGTNHASEGRISFLWNDPANEIRTLEDGSVIFELVFEPNSPLSTIHSPLSLDGSVTRVEAYDKDYILHNVVLKRVENSSVVQDSWSVVPNPVTDGLIHVQMTLKDKKKIVFSLTDNTGKVILTKPVEANKGSNTFILKTVGNISPGIYYLKAGGVEGVKQLIIN